MIIMKTKVLFYALFISLFVCCNGTPDSAIETVKNDEIVQYAAAASYAPSEAVDSAVAAVDMSVPMPDREQVETKIIKSGNLRFQTDDLDKTYSQIQEAVKKYNASIKNDSQYKGSEDFSRSLTVRVPNENFDAFIDAISKGVSYFDRKEISSDDVTEEYIDVASRIKTKKVLEERYYELLKKANKVSEMLEIEKKLSEIREEIEAKEGRLRYIENKVSMSTLYIDFYKPIAKGQKARVSYGGRMGNALVSGFNGISNFFIEAIGYWPVIVTLVVLILLIRKRLKRKNKNDVIEN